MLTLRVPLRRRPLTERGYIGATATRQARDRGLDHAVDREKHLKPMLAIKELIKSEPTRSIPLSVINQNNYRLKVPIRPMEFIRKHPSVFEEFLPAGADFHPHIRLKSQVLEIDSEEHLVFQSERYKNDVANRLVKLLMISRVHKIPLSVLGTIKWDLGLPDDYASSIVPEFPDYFRVVHGGRSSSALELVCWNEELAVSLLENNSYGKGTHSCAGGPVTFPMQFHKNFEMDKKFKKLLDEWQKVAYISPYENAMHLGSHSVESDKWVMGILHEILNLFVSKKAERETLLGIGEWLGVRSRMKRALVNHPGIFYVANRTWTETVLLKEAYRRGSLIEKNQLMEIRSRYVHLMNKVVDRKNAVSCPEGSKPIDKTPRFSIKEKNDDSLKGSINCDTNSVETKVKSATKKTRNSESVSRPPRCSKNTFAKNRYEKKDNAQAYANPRTKNQVSKQVKSAFQIKRPRKSKERMRAV